MKQCLCQVVYVNNIKVKIQGLISGFALGSDIQFMCNFRYNFKYYKLMFVSDQ